PPPQEMAVGIAFLSGSTRQGRLGIGSAAILEARQADAAAVSELHLSQIDATFSRLQSLQGSGSTSSRAALLRELFRRATAAEQDFLVRLLFGELRQGALEGVLVEAVAKAAAIPAAVIRRATMLSGSLPGVAARALTEGRTAVDAFVIQPMRPVQPMLAESAADLGEALDEIGEAAVEYKLDGARIQVHKLDDEVRVFSRNLRDVTH